MLNDRVHGRVHVRDLPIDAITAGAEAGPHVGIGPEALQGIDTRKAIAVGLISVANRPIGRVFTLPSLTSIRRNKHLSVS